MIVLKDFEMMRIKLQLNHGIEYSYFNRTMTRTPLANTIATPELKQLISKYSIFLKFCLF